MLSLFLLLIVSSELTLSLSSLLLFYFLHFPPFSNFSAVTFAQVSIVFRPAGHWLHEKLKLSILSFLFQQGIPWRRSSPHLSLLQLFSFNLRWHFTITPLLSSYFLSLSLPFLSVRDLSLDDFTSDPRASRQWPPWCRRPRPPQAGWWLGSSKAWK